MLATMRFITYAPKFPSFRNIENIFTLRYYHYLFSGGFYHGKLMFPREFPFKPPSIYIQTPNGRFKCNTRLCLSISDFHPDTWNPAWSVSTILTGLLSFMVSLPSRYSLTLTCFRLIEILKNLTCFRKKKNDVRTMFVDLVSTLLDRVDALFLYKQRSR